jgi:hypothetical protein
MNSVALIVSEKVLHWRKKTNMTVNLLAAQAIVALYFVMNAYLNSFPLCSFSFVMVSWLTTNKTESFV